MAVIQAWFIALLSGPWSPLWAPYVGSAVVLLIALVIITGMVVFTCVVRNIYVEVIFLWYSTAVIWVVYLVGAAIFLFPNWGGISVFGVS